MGWGAHLGVPVVMITHSDPAQPLNESLCLSFSRRTDSVEEITDIQREPENSTPNRRTQP